MLLLTKRAGIRDVTCLELDGGMDIGGVTHLRRHGVVRVVAVLRLAEL